MEKSFPMNDTPYLAEDLRMWFAGRTSGVLSLNNCLSVSAAGGMNIKLGPGIAFLQAGTNGLGGSMYANQSDLIFALDPADSILNRIDAVVIRYDVLKNTIKAAILKGTPSSSAVTPKITRTATVYEIMVAIVSINKGISSVTPSMIYETRTNAEVCGMIRDNIERIPTDVFEAAFYDWFEHIKGQLDEDAAGHLQLQIDKMITDGKEKIVSKAFETTGESFELIENGIGEATMTFKNNTGIPSIELIGDFAEKGELSIYEDSQMLDGTFTIESANGLKIKSPILRVTSDIRIERSGHPYFGATSCGLNSQGEPMIGLALCTAESDFDWANSLQVYSNRVITNKDFVCGGKLGGAAICAGAVNITPVPNVPTKVTVNFTVRLSGTPIGVASANSTVPGTGITGVSVANITNAKMDIYITRTNNSPTLIEWIAMAS